MRQMCGMLLLLSLAGCSSSGPSALPLYPVTGTFVVGGKPLKDTIVQLVPSDPESKAKPGIGRTDAEGKFMIRTNGDKGANPGKYKVVLGTGADDSASKGPMSVEDASKMSGQYVKSKGIPTATLPFPKEWASAKTSPKEIEVVKGPVTVNIDI